MKIWLRVSSMYIMWGENPPKKKPETVEKADGLTDIKLQSSRKSKLRISHKIINNLFYKVKSTVVNC